MAGAAATTYYDVVTRYRVENAADEGLGRYSRATDRADRRSERLHGTTRRLTRSFRLLHAAVIPIAGSALGLAGFGFATVKVFRNLNDEMTNTIQLAGQLNLAFQYSTDPAANFALSMEKSRSLFRELVRDAAALPGELSDFLGMGRQISGAVFAAGGSTQQFRELIGRLAMATPSTGGTFEMTGLGAMQMLQGVARVTNPLFRMMATSGLLGPGVNSAGAFNALTAAERLRLLDEGLAKLVDNPMFRSSVLRTFDTQLGTLADNLFGIESILGKLTEDSFQGLLDGLVAINDFIERNSQGWLDWARMFGLNSIGTLGLSHAQARTFLGAPPGNYNLPGRGAPLPLWARIAGAEPLDQIAASEFERLVKTRATRELQREMVGESGPPRAFPGLALEREQFLEPHQILGGMSRGEFHDFPYWQQRYEDAIDRAREDLQRLMTEGNKPLEDPPHRDLVDPARIEQNFHIKLDVSTDESPEATAVRIRRAMELVGKHPTTTRRGTSLIPTPSAIP